MKFFKFIRLAIFFSIGLMSSTLVHNPALAESVSESIITDPSISRRCDNMLQQRQDKVQHRQRLLFLLDRNKSLLKETPEAKKSIAEKLRANQYKIIQELRITNLKVVKLEEQIVRRGCPGLTL